MWQRTSQLHISHFPCVAAHHERHIMLYRLGKCGIDNGFANMIQSPTKWLEQEREKKCVHVFRLRFESFLIRNNFSIYIFPGAERSPWATFCLLFVDDVRCARWTNNNANILIERTKNKKQTKTREHVYFQVNLGSVAFVQFRFDDDVVYVRYASYVDTAVNAVIGLLFDFQLWNNIRHRGRGIHRPSIASLIEKPVALRECVNM